jgi:hypothetical protein
VPTGGPGHCAGLAAGADPCRMGGGASSRGARPSMADTDARVPDLKKFDLITLLLLSFKGKVSRKSW